MREHKYWLARLIVTSWACSIAVVTLTAPESLAGRALAHAGPLGYALVALLLWITGIGLVDNFINDLLPQRFKLSVMNYRHIGFMAMAVSLVLLGAATAMKTATPAVLPSYLLPALFAVVVTWADILDRHGASQK